MFGASFSTRAQVCGYSVVTIYLQDAGGRAVENAVFEFVNTGDDSDGHYGSTTKIYRDAKRNAYVLRHGMCGAHNEAAVSISVEGFVAVEQKLELPLGRQGLILKLKRSGTDEKVSLKKLSCETPGECASFGEMYRSQN